MMHLKSVRSLLQHDYAETGSREFLGHDAAGPKQPSMQCAHCASCTLAAEVFGLMIRLTIAP
jgi:hypothetical protein